MRVSQSTMESARSAPIRTLPAWMSAWHRTGAGERARRASPRASARDDMGDVVALGAEERRQLRRDRIGERRGLDPRLERPDQIAPGRGIAFLRDGRLERARHDCGVHGLEGDTELHPLALRQRRREPILTADEREKDHREGAHARPEVVCGGFDRGNNLCDAVVMKEAGGGHLDLLT